MSSGLEAGQCGGMRHRCLGRGMPGGSAAFANGKAAPGQATARPGASGELVFQRRSQAEGAPGQLLAEIFHLSSCFRSSSKPFCLGSVALRHETQHPPSRPEVGIDQGEVWHTGFINEAETAFSFLFFLLLALFYSPLSPVNKISLAVGEQHKQMDLSKGQANLAT